MLSFLRHHGLYLRIIAVFLVISAVTLTAYPAFIPTAAADEPVYTQKSIYKWDRYYQHFDAPWEGADITGMLIWRSGGIYYATCGMETGSKNRSFYGVDITNNPMLKFNPDWKKDSSSSNPPPGSFYTDSLLDAWHFIGTGKDSNKETNYFKCVKIRMADGKTYAYDDDNHLGFSTEHSTQWTVAGAGVNDGDGYASNATYGYASILHTRSGYDRYFDTDGNRLTVNEYSIFVGGFDYDAPDFLYYQVFEHEDYSCLGDYTVKSGTTLQIKNNTWLDKNRTLTVEPGAVLSVSGKFINSGMIENYGTVIVDENASVYYFGDRSSTGGTINNYGSGSLYMGASGSLPGEGNLLIMPGARVLLPAIDATGADSKARISLTKGATLVNYGLLFVPGKIYASSAHIQNKPSGVVCSHCAIGGGEYNVKDFKWAKKDNFGLSELTGIQNDFDGTNTVIENDGYWHNYYQKTADGNVIYSGGGSID